MSTQLFIMHSSQSSLLNHYKDMYHKATLPDDRTCGTVPRAVVMSSAKDDTNVLL